MKLDFVNPVYLEYLNSKYNKKYNYSNVSFDDYKKFINKIERFLSKEERDILYCLMKGRNKREIARILNKNYITRFCNKVDRTIELVNKFFVFDKQNNIHGFYKFKEKYVVLIECFLKRKPLSYIRKECGGYFTFNKSMNELFEFLENNHNNWYVFLKSL